MDSWVISTILAIRNFKKRTTNSRAIVRSGSQWLAVVRRRSSTWKTIIFEQNKDLFPKKLRTQIIQAKIFLFLK